VADEAPSRPAAPPISVVIPTRNRPDSLEECLATAAAALRPGDELLVADSASTIPGTREAAERHGARYVRAEVKGASRARNLGWRSAKHEIIAFIDDDVRVAKTWVAAFSESFRDHPEFGFMTGRVGVPEHQVETTKRPVAEKVETEPAVLDADFVGVPGHSANMAARRHVMEKVGGFDERLGPGGDFRNTEDLDIFDRFLAAGEIGRYEPAAEGWHDQWRDRRELLRLDWAYGFGMGARVSKLLRTNPRRAREAAEVLYWSWGIRDVREKWSIRSRFLALTAAVRVAGGVVGFARCLPVGVKDGHFAPPLELGRRLRHVSSRYRPR
jgi:glycosyltransferase involved in cell wall biosynthesis